MPFKTHNKRSLYLLLGALGLAAFGQYFLAQRENPHTLIPGLLFYALAVGFFLWATPKPAPFGTPDPGLGFRWEVAGFISIMALALFLRVYRLDQFPAGIYYDESCLGWGGLTILREGWRPFYEIYHLSNGNISLYYPMALWFKYISPTQVHFFLFSVFLTLAAFPLAYWTFRQLAGSRVALLALFIMAVMRWNITFSRNNHPAFEILFYILGALAFFLYGLRTGKSWAYSVGTVFFTGGFYSYQSYRAFPLLILVLFLYEFGWNPEKPKIQWKALLTSGVISLILLSPLWLYWIKNGFMSWREKEVSVFPKILESGSLVPLISHLMEGVLMFNRQGDSWHIHNLPNCRMLDDVTGVLLVLGFFLALFHLRNRKYFYALTGFGVMCLPALLSNDATSASRSYGAIPFVALLSACALDSIWMRLRSLRKPPATWLPGALVFTGLGLMLVLNFKTYFEEQALNYSGWRGADTDKTIVGKSVARYGEKYEYYLSPFFYLNYTVVFLGFSEKYHMHPLSLPESLALTDLSTGRGAFFALEDGQFGVLQLLQSVFPGGETETVKDIQGHSLVYFFRVSPDRISGGQARAKELLRSNFGLRGTYRASLDPHSAPVTVHRDPILNFPSAKDFPLPGGNPQCVRWEGYLSVPSKGTYSFLTLASDSSTLWIDQKATPMACNEPSKDFNLAGGSHRIAIEFQNTSSFYPVFSFLWKKPGDAKFEVVPASAFHLP